MLPVADEAMNAIRAKHVRALAFANRRAPSMTRVIVRPNLNFSVTGEDGKKYSIQTIHDKGSINGGVIGFDLSATVCGVHFIVDEQARTKIAGGRHKFPMAGVAGFLAQIEPSLEGVEIRFNPKTDNLFTRVDDGRPVKTADLVTVFHNRVYARGKITYWEGIASDAPA
jgi:hypothetical protein